jgi:hypothetical protein
MHWLRYIPESTSVATQKVALSFQEDFVHQSDCALARKRRVIEPPSF